MSTTLDVIRVIIGLAILYGGAEALIRGTAGLARSFGVKPLVLGLTVVAYGTSAPELAVATSAVAVHAQPIALGTIIGACAANIGLILGLTALIDRRIIRREVPVLLGSAIVVPFFLRDGVLSRLEGLFLIGCAALFTIATLTVSARLDANDPAPTESAIRVISAADFGRRGKPGKSRITAVVLSAMGIALLVVGAQLFVGGARGLAGQVGMSERMLGMSVIALGTSLPELVMSLIAATRGQASLAVGSVIGSSLLNVFLVLGVSAYLRPIRLVERLHPVDGIGLVAITLLGTFMLRGSRRISRIEGVILIAAYIGFIVATSLL